MQFTQTHTIKAIGEFRREAFTDKVSPQGLSDRASPSFPQPGLGLVAVGQKVAHECGSARTAAAESLAA